MKIQAIKTATFEEHGDLIAFVLTAVKKLPEKSVVVVSSKIVALAEGRTASLKEKTKLIKKESEWALPSSKVFLTLKDGVLGANAGIDESNANGKLMLLPKNSFASAHKLRTALQKKYKLKNLGVIITDSALMPLRAGVIGVALGYAGFKGVRDYRGKKDIFGRRMEFSRTNVADSLATTATLLMGEADEHQPLALITNAPVEFIDSVKKNEMRITPREDIFWPVLKKIKKN